MNEQAQIKHEFSGRSWKKETSKGYWSGKWDFQAISSKPYDILLTVYNVPEGFTMNNKEIEALINSHKVPYLTAYYFESEAHRPKGLTRYIYNVNKWGEELFDVQKLKIGTVKPSE